VRFVGNDKVPPSEQRRLKVLKAVKQGLYLRPARSWWPALMTLSREDEAAVRAHVRDVFVWEASSTLLERQRPQR
jgi:hypothetical protein